MNRGRAIDHSWFSNRNRLIFAAIVFLLAYFLFDGPFGYSSICTKCGKRRYSRDWAVPFTSMKVATIHAETDTPLSVTLTQKAIVSQHSHEWLFIHGSGHGITCAIGSGSSLMGVTNQRVADTIALLHDRGKIEFRDRLVTGVLDPKNSSLYRVATGFPPPITISDAELDNWIDQQSQYIEDLRRVQ